MKQENGAERYGASQLVVKVAKKVHRLQQPMQETKQVKSNRLVSKLIEQERQFNTYACTYIFLYSRNSRHSTSTWTTWLVRLGTQPLRHILHAGVATNGFVISSTNCLWINIRWNMLVVGLMCGSCLSCQIATWCVLFLISCTDVCL